MKKRFKLLFLLSILSLLLFSCKSGTFNHEMKSEDLTGRIHAKQQPVDRWILKEKSNSYMDFAIRILKENIKNDDNMLISPLSIIYAMGMTTNGADKNTLKEIEETFGMSLDEMNDYLNAYRQERLANEKVKFELANSVWLKDDKDFVVNQDFLQKNKDFYESEVFKADFDENTLKEINLWVSKKTDGMIEHILDKIGDRAIMYIINALCFDAKWDEPYMQNQVVKDFDFHSYSGTLRKVKMLFSDEYKYLKDEKASGFMKYYEGGDYAFAALLPDEGVDIKAYIAAMDSKHLTDLLNSVQDTKVSAALPAFQVDYNTELSEVLQSMGIIDAFDSNKANFSKIGKMSSGLPIFISRILHKTHIEVDELGTKAGAATVVEMAEGSAAPEERKEVILNRPFIYMIVDTKTNIPVFIGTAMDIGK